MFFFFFCSFQTNSNEQKAWVLSNVQAKGKHPWADYKNGIGNTLIVLCIKIEILMKLGLILYETQIALDIKKSQGLLIFGF